MFIFKSSSNLKESGYVKSCLLPIMWSQLKNQWFQFSKQTSPPSLLFCKAMPYQVYRISLHNQIGCITAKPFPDFLHNCTSDRDLISKLGGELVAHHSGQYCWNTVQYTWWALHNIIININLLSLYSNNSESNAQNYFYLSYQKVNKRFFGNNLLQFFKFLQSILKGRKKNWIAFLRDRSNII